MPVTFGDISAASFRIRGGVPTTPVQWNKRLSREIGNGISIALKREFELPTGSFKERGALNALLCMTKKQRKSGVIAASAGNHAAALAYHSGRLGIACTVVMPTVAPLNKIQTCEDFGANVIVQGAHIGEAREVANGIAESTGALYINGFDDPAIIAGAGTMGLEIMSQCDGLDALVIPVGGGGLIAGVAAAVKSVHPDVLIIGAEPEILPSMSLALQNGGPVETPVQGGTLADGLWVPRVGDNAYKMVERYVDRIVTVKEKYIALAMLRLMECDKAVVEGGGATGVAAVLQGCVPELSGKRVMVPLCGGNVDTSQLTRAVDRGLAADFRLVRLTCSVSDRPGGLAEFTSAIAGVGASIKDLVHQRAFISPSKNVRHAQPTQVLCILETRGKAHAKAVVDRMLELGFLHQEDLSSSPELREVYE